MTTMTQQEFDKHQTPFHKACLKFLQYVQKELQPIDGEYVVDFRTIKRVCGLYADSVFMELACSDIATTDNLLFKGLAINQDGIKDAIIYYKNKINM